MVHVQAETIVQRPQFAGSLSAEHQQGGDHHAPSPQLRHCHVSWPIYDGRQRHPASECTVTYLSALDLGGSYSAFSNRGWHDSNFSRNSSFRGIRAGFAAAPDRMLKKDLAGLDDRELLDIVRFSPRSSNRRAAACELWLRRFHLAKSSRHTVPDNLGGATSRRHGEAEVRAPAIPEPGVPAVAPQTAARTGGQTPSNTCVPLQMAVAL